MAETNSKGIFDLSSVYDRQVAGYAPVTPTFTPENLNNTTVLQIQGKNALGGNNKTFLDSSGNGLALTPNGTPTQGSFSPFSPVGWGGYFSATGNYVYTANSAFNISSATAVWTFEYWVNPQTNGVHLCIGNGGGYGNSFWVGYNASTLKFSVGQGTGGANPIDFATTSTYPLNNWYHVAVTRTSAGVVTIYVNGVAAGTQTYASAVNSGTTFVINGLYDSNGIGNSGGTFSAYNVRFVMGSLVYTKTFVPPTAPLTAIPGTVLLALQDNRFKDNSVNNNTFTVGGTPRVALVSPFLQTTEYNKNVHGASGYFNGSTDYLITPLSSQFNLTGDFTIECWIYKTNPAADGNGIFGIGSQDPDSNLVRISSGVLQFWLGGSNSGASGTGTKTGIISCSTSIKNYTWYHIALVRSGSATNNVKLYLNGKLDGQGTGTYEIPSNYLVIGRDYPTYSTEYFPGHITDLRVVKGTALYTSSFTPPTAPLTPVTNTSLLVKFDNAAIVDSTTENNLITVGDAKLSTAVTKFNKSAMYFDGTGDYISIPINSNFNFGTGNFTIEGWFYALTDQSTDFMIDFRGGVATAPAMFVYTGNQLAWYYNGSIVYQPTSLTFTYNTWNHVAIVRSSGVTKFYLNGVGASTTYTDTNNYPIAPCVIGSDVLAGGSSYWNGYIDDLRITKGVARYASTFTPTPLEKDKTIALEVLIVAGGGGGGRKRTPGGGAGGLLYYGNNTTTKTPNGPPIIAYSGASYAVAVGLGGATNVSGANSSFGSYVSYGGQGNNSTVIGGSSAGVGTKLWTQGQGQGGGVSANGGQGGGGGAGEQGKTGGAIATNTGGYGGNGLSYAEFTAVAGVPAGWFAGGGGGGGLLATAESGGPGGLGGGGYGGNVYGSQTKAYGYNGNAYTGGGGGGTSDVHSSQDGGLGAQGGSGIVIVSYAGTSALATGGTISTTARPGYVCHTFTGVGTFAVT